MYVKAKKSLGQNFMINPHILDKIVDSADISKDDVVLEVGPGTGNLTKKLADKASRVLAIEKDHRLIEQLRKEYSTNQAVDQVVEIIEEDILKFNPGDHGLAPSAYKIVANIPYYITSHFLKTIFESSNWRMTPPSLIVLTIQKEVGERMTAKPPHMNLLALSIQYYSDLKIIGNISKNNFRPIPKIDSAIIRLIPKSITHNTKYETQLFQLMRAGFAEKRKQLASTLSKQLRLDKERVITALEKNNLEPRIRPENLSLDDWQKLAEGLFS